MNSPAFRRTLRAARRLLLSTLCAYLGGLIAWTTYFFLPMHGVPVGWTLKDALALLAVPMFPMITGNTGLLLFLLVVMFFPITFGIRSTCLFLATSAAAGLSGILVPPIGDLIESILFWTPLELKRGPGVDWQLHVIAGLTAFIAGAIYLLLVRRSAGRRILTSS